MTPLPPQRLPQMPKKPAEGAARTSHIPHDESPKEAPTEVALTGEKFPTTTEKSTERGDPSTKVKVPVAQAKTTVRRLNEGPAKIPPGEVPAAHAKIKTPATTPMKDERPPSYTKVPTEAPDTPTKVKTHPEAPSPQPMLQPRPISIPADFSQGFQPRPACVPVFQFSSVQMFQCFSVPVFQCSCQHSDQSSSRCRPVLPNISDVFPSVLRAHHARKVPCTNPRRIYPVTPMSPVIPVTYDSTGSRHILPTATARPITATARPPHPVQTPEGWNVLWLLNNNQNLYYPPPPHVTQGPGFTHQPRTDIGLSRSTGPHSPLGPYTRPGQTTVSPRSTGPTSDRGTSPSGDQTPARGRQRSVPGQVVSSPPVTLSQSGNSS